MHPLIPSRPIRLWSAPVSALEIPRFRYPQKQFVESPVVIASDKDPVRLLATEPLLAGLSTTNVYSGPGSRHRHGIMNWESGRPESVNVKGNITPMVSQHQGRLWSL